MCTTEDIEVEREIEMKPTTAPEALQATAIDVDGLRMSQKTEVSGVDLSWSNVTYTVETKDKEKSTKHILNQVSGRVERGRLLAIMGSSEWDRRRD